MTDLDIYLRKLIQSKLDGNATPEQEKLLNDWLSKIEQSNIDLDNIEVSSIKKHAYQELIDQIHATTSSDKQNIHWKYWGSLAASLLGIIILVSYLFSNHHSNRSIAATIQPGKDTALFTNADGQNYALNNKATFQSQSIQVHNGILEYKNIKTSNSFKNNVLKTPFGGQFQIVLPDGTHVWLNAGSELNFPTKFETTERLVEVKGEAYFEVAHNPKCPFKVKSNNELIEVLGTHFNVQNYPNEAASTVTLLEGKIKYSSANYSQILLPGQQIMTHQGNIDLTNVDTTAVVDWKNGDFYLGGQDYKSLLRKIARWYDFNLTYSKNAPASLELGGWISRNQSLQSILEKLSLTNKIHFKIEEKNVTVSN